MPTHFAQRSSDALQCNYSNYDENREHYGFYRFNKEQSYEGKFLGERLHGEGTYKWDDSVHEGGFYSNCKEGYASLSFDDNSHFEGLFIKNKPFGPGVFTYPNGRQDVGFWVGRKLVRLSRPVDFIIPRLAASTTGKLKLLPFRRVTLIQDSLPNTDILLKYGVESYIGSFPTHIYDPRSFFFDVQTFDQAYFSPTEKRKLELDAFSKDVQPCEDLEEDQEGRCFKERPTCPLDMLLTKCDSDEDFYGGDEGEEGEIELGILSYFKRRGTLSGLVSGRSTSENEIKVPLQLRLSKRKSKILTIMSWNRSELCTEMLKQMFRFRNFEGRVNFNPTKLTTGARTEFRKTGEKEMQCLLFLKMCSLGPAQEIKGLLCSYEISEELMDGRGNNSLMFAAATDQHDVIDVLLNYGVDVNAFNDEGLTPLNLCLLRRLSFAHGLSSWETAFLPSETEEFHEKMIYNREHLFQESIPSIDRMFGDGMSLNESNIFTPISQDLTPIPSSPPPKRSLAKSLEKMKERSRSYGACSSSSKSQGSFGLFNWEWEFRQRKDSSAPKSNITPTIDIRIVPKSLKNYEYEKSIEKPTSTDKYLFEITFEKNPNTLKAEEPVSPERKKSKKKVKHESVEDEDEGEAKEVEVVYDYDSSQKIAEIDKTIAMLLRRGADPNKAEVPRPAIHLGIYTKDLDVLHSLLYYGANPDAHLHSNEYLLSPLHVLVLQKPRPVYVDMCELLLKFKANPDTETLQNFILSEDDKNYLDYEYGRTPLQLLCMRPDLEYADPNGDLIKIGLLLAKACNRKLLYNGHSYLTLAMLLGNVKLLRALLNSRYFDPNDLLRDDRGTALHVLVSTQLQKKTPYETSIEMCNLLLKARANPTKRITHSKIVKGTCVDYGYSQIEQEKEARKIPGQTESAKKVEKTHKEKPVERDYLIDHERVVEYLANVAKEFGKKKSTKRLEELKSIATESEYSRTSAKWKGLTKGSLEMLHGWRSEEGEVKGGEKVGSQENLSGKELGLTSEREEFAEERFDSEGLALNAWDGKKQEGVSPATKGKAGKKQGRESVSDGTKGRRRKAGSKDSYDKEQDRGGVPGRGKGKRQIGSDKAGDSYGKDRDRGGASGSARRKRNVGSAEAGDSYGKDQHRRGASGRAKGQLGVIFGDSAKRTKYPREKSKKGGGDSKDREKSKKGRGDSKDKQKRRDLKSEEHRERQKYGVESLNRLIAKRLARGQGLPQAADLSSTTSDLQTPEEDTFRQLLKLYGNCVKMNLKQFLAPYVVLRNGELYYKFKGKTTQQKEQYSLV